VPGTLPWAWNRYYVKTLLMHPDTYTVLRAGYAAHALGLDTRGIVILDRIFPKGQAYTMPLEAYARFKLDGFLAGDITFLKVE